MRIALLGDLDQIAGLDCRTRLPDQLIGVTSLNREARSDAASASGCHLPRVCIKALIDLHDIAVLVGEGHPAHHHGHITIHEERGCL